MIQSCEKAMAMIVNTNAQIVGTYKNAELQSSTEGYKNAVIIPSCDKAMTMIVKTYSQIIETDTKCRVTEFNKMHTQSQKTQSDTVQQNSYKNADTNTKAQRYTVQHNVTKMQNQIQK